MPPTHTPFPPGTLAPLAHQNPHHFPLPHHCRCPICTSLWVVLPPPHIHINRSHTLAVHFPPIHEQLPPPSTPHAQAWNGSPVSPLLLLTHACRYCKMHGL